MRDQHELALKCLEAERRGASVHDFLRGMGFISPKATWERLQLNELGRKANDLKDGKEEQSMAKLTLDVKKKAVQIALDGGDYLEYLKQNGAKNPSASWAYIMECARKNDPNNYLQLKGRLEENAAKKAAEKKTAEKKPAEEPKPELKQETEIRFAPDEEHLQKITQPLKYGDFVVRSIEGLYGRYDRDFFNGHDYIDFSTKDGDELHMTVEHWKAFILELNQAAKVLGVDLDG